MSAGASTDMSPVKLTVEGNIARITIARPQKRNALTRDMCVQLEEMFVGLGRDPEIAVVAIEGAGGNFCAGVDIAQLDEVLFGFDAAGQQTDQLSTLDAAIGSINKPTVALIQGVCMGGGWQLASACDLVVCSDDAQFALTPAKLGILYPQRGLNRLVRRVGQDRAKLLMFSGDRIDAVQAERWGLVTLSVPAKSFFEQSERLLDRIAKRSRYSITHSKKFIDLDIDEAESRGVLWRRVWSDMRGNEDFAAGQAAFLKRIEPDFTWRPRD